MLYELSVFRPHSSSDPFGATFPPGEGFGRNAIVAQMKSSFALTPKVLGVGTVSNWMI